MYPVNSVSNGSKFPGRFWFRFHTNPDRAMGFTTLTTRTVGIGPVLPAKPGISTSQFELQLSI